MRAILILFVLGLTACTPLHSYNASVESPAGMVKITGLRGGLIDIVHPDGTHIRADDRGHPDQPSALSNMASVAGAALINREAD